MNPALVLLAAITIGGAVLAVSARDVRATALGLLVVFLGAPLLVDPWPGPATILARMAAALLAIRIVEIGLRGEDTTGGTRLGWPAEALLAAAAAVIGFGSHGLGAAGLGPAEAQAAGFALIVLAIAPLATGRDVLRVAIGSVLLVMGATLIRAGLDAPPSDAEHLVLGLLTIALGGAVGVIATAARAAGGLATIGVADIGERGPRLPDAHRPDERETKPGAGARPRPGRPAPPAPRRSDPPAPRRSDPPAPRRSDRPGPRRAGPPPP